MRQQLIEQLECYQPVNEQEEKDKAVILDLLLHQDDIFDRKNKHYHMTASAWVTNQERNKVLMVYHNIYHSWSWLGGHADGEEDLAAVALKEVKEESGVEAVRLLQKEPISLEILTVDGHEKRGEYVSPHLHLNVTYLIEADENEMLKIKEDENSGVKWFGLNEAIQVSSEPWFQERIYPKLNRKLEQFAKDEKESSLDYNG